jgi:hypothetical protein
LKIELVIAEKTLVARDDHTRLELWRDLAGDFWVRSGDGFEAVQTATIRRIDGRTSIVFARAPEPDYVHGSNFARLHPRLRAVE